MEFRTIEEICKGCEFWIERRTALTEGCARYEDKHYCPKLRVEIMGYSQEPKIKRKI